MADTVEPGAATLFLCGEVMTGRGIDQILPHPGGAEIFESCMRSAAEYVRLAEEAAGAIPRPVPFDYVWGDAIGELARYRPDASIINLETAVTTAGDHWPGKRVHYRMHPANVRCLSAAKIDCCVLANNHVLDWGSEGLAETVQVLDRAGIRTAGAGMDEGPAARPATIEMAGRGRVHVFGFAMESSGVPCEWAAGPDRPGVNLLQDISQATVDDIARQIGKCRGPGDIVVASIHWGGNWGYEIPPEHRWFAQQLIDSAGVHVVHGHSSHHPLAMEVYRSRLILYGCGDFINDYEGIPGYEEYRPDLTLMYLPTLETGGGRLLRLALVPMQIRHLRVNHAPAEAGAWLADRLSREGRVFGTRVERGVRGSLRLAWNRD